MVTKAGLTLDTFTVGKAIESMNVNMSDGRFPIDGTWQDKLRIYEDTYTIGEIRKGHEREDIKKLPNGKRCYATFLPSLQVIRWANSEKIKDALGGERHDYVNRGDAKKEKDPRRGYITVSGNDVTVVSS
jgi:hypothetical protein